MNTRLRAGVGGVTAVVLATVGASTALAATDEQLTDLYRPAPVATYGDIVATSEYEPASQRYRLVMVHGGERTALPVAPRTVPFDVDAGPAGDGGVVLAYSRCETDPRLDNERSRMPEWSTGRGCDVFRYDPQTGQETKVTGVSTSSSSEYLPSVWRDQIAFARVYEARDGRRGQYPYLYVRSLEDGSGSQRQPGGARGRDGFENGPRTLDLYGRRLSFVWASFLPTGSAGVPVEAKPFDDELRVDTVGGQHRRVDVATGDSSDRAVDFVSVTGNRGNVHYVQECSGDCPSGSQRREHRYGLSDGKRAIAMLPSSTTQVDEGTRTIKLPDRYLAAVRNGEVTIALRGPIGAEVTRPEARDWEAVRLEGLSFRRR